MQKQSNVAKSLGGGKRRIRFGPRAQLGAVSHPPQLKPAIAISKTFRFQSNAAVTGPISAAELSGVIVMATTATTSAYVITSARLRKVEAWALPTQGGGGSEIEISGPITTPGPENRVTDISMGVTPAHCRWHPAPNSVPDLWFLNTTNQPMFEIAVPANATIDVTMDLVLNFSDAPLAGPVPAAAVAGTIYGVPLDGFGGHLLPVDWTVLP